MKMTISILRNKKVLLLFACLSILFLASCSFGGKENIESSDSDVEVNAAIQEYIAYISNQEWDKALSLLSGQALTVTKNNLLGHKDLKQMSIDSITISQTLKTEDHAISEVSVVMKDGELVYAGDYRYSLFKDDDGKWKIYSIEELNNIDLAEGKKVTDKESENIVKDYLNSVSSGDYENALKYLTSPALDKAGVEAAKTMIFKISDIKTETIYTNSSTSLIKAKYTSTSEKPRQITAVFIVKKLEKPLISKIYIEKII